MSATELRKIAESISTDRAQAQADVEGYEHLLTVMDEDYGAKDVQEVRDKLREADRRLDDLAEQEHHAWGAYNDASQAEHHEYMQEREDY